MADSVGRVQGGGQQDGRPRRRPLSDISTNVQETGKRVHAAQHADGPQLPRQDSYNDVPARPRPKRAHGRRRKRGAAPCHDESFGSDHTVAGMARSPSPRHLPDAACHQHQVTPPRSASPPRQSPSPSKSPSDQRVTLRSPVDPWSQFRRNGSPSEQGSECTGLGGPGARSLPDRWVDDIDELGTSSPQPRGAATPPPRVGGSQSAPPRPTPPPNLSSAREASPPPRAWHRSPNPGYAAGVLPPIASSRQSAGRLPTLECEQPDDMLGAALSPPPHVPCAATPPLPQAGSRQPSCAPSTSPAYRAAGEQSRGDQTPARIIFIMPRSSEERHLSMRQGPGQLFSPCRQQISPGPALPWEAYRPPPPPLLEAAPVYDPCFASDFGAAAAQQPPVAQRFSPQPQPHPQAQQPPSRSASRSERQCSRSRRGFSGGRFSSDDRIRSLGLFSNLLNRTAAPYLCLVQHKGARCEEYVSQEFHSRGSFVLVEGDRGVDLGYLLNCLDRSERHGWPRSTTRCVLSKATEAEYRIWSEEIPQLEESALGIARQVAANLGVPLEIHSAEFQLDRAKVTFKYSRLYGVERVEFRELNTELFRHFKCRVWLSDKVD